MKILVNQDFKEVGMVASNMLYLSDGSFAGVVLGDCIFNHRGVLTAKYIFNKVYDLKGSIIASREAVSRLPETFTVVIRPDLAWSVLSRIKEHSHSKIIPRQQWSPTPFCDLFRN